MELTPQQRAIVQAIYDRFRDEGRWPVIDAIDRIADERWEIDAFAILRELPTEIALLDRIHLAADQPVKLRVRAVAAFDGAEADLELFVRVVRWLADKERGFQPVSAQSAARPRVSSEQLAADLAQEGWDLDDIALAKVYSLVEIERISWGGTSEIGGRAGAWEVDLTRDIRSFRRVHTLEDYIAARERVDEAAASAMRAFPLAAGTPTVSPGPERRADDGSHYVFIAMPFGADWSAPVHEAIERACERLHASGIALRWGGPTRSTAPAGSPIRSSMRLPPQTW